MSFIVLESFTLLLVLHILHVVLVSGLCRFKRSLLIQDGIINAKQCPTAAQIADIGSKALPRVPFESFTDQLLGDKHVGGK